MNDRILMVSVIVVSVVLAVVAGISILGGRNAPAQSARPNGFVPQFFHDAPHHVSCWSFGTYAIACLPDSEVFQP